MNFIQHIFQRLEQSPERLLLEELRPQGNVSIDCRGLLRNISIARAFFAASGLAKGDRCALLAPNGIDWVALDLAAMAEGLIVVPLYTRQAPAELALMLRDAQPKLVLCGTTDLLDRLQAALQQSPAPPPRLVLAAQALSSSSPPPPPTPPAPLADSDPVAIIYTSGTSGQPKGVVLNVANVTFILSCTTARLDKLLGPSSETECVFHYLPFCFASSWLLMLTCLSRHSLLRLSTDLSRLAEDLRQSRPHYCVNVPALLERMRAAIEAQLAARGLLHRVFRDARQAWLAKSSSSKLRAAFSLALARAFLFPAIRKKFGGNLKALISGSAPLSRDTQLFFLMLGIPVLQVYGLTETTGICTMDDPGRVEPGAVGPPIPGVEMTLGPSGEILVRGPNVFPGYWNRPAETAMALEGGWFHTGDQGERTAAGNWRIVGRLKNLLILSSGHNVAPEPLEEALLRAIPGVQQAVVFGHSRSYLTALLTGDVPHERAAKEIARLNAGWPHYRQIRAFHIEPKPFTMESGLLTANGKLRRDSIAARFRAEIEMMYNRTA